MSTTEDVRGHRRAKKPHQVMPKWSALDRPLSTSHPDQVLSFHEWCRLNRVSTRTGRRIITSDNGPVVTQLTPKRIGITIRNNAIWQKSRERA
jgi:hypothetical protein